MALKAIHEKLDDIPDQYQDLYTEKDGKYELTGIQGIKTQGDVDRVTESLRRQTDLHKETKAKLAVWGELKHDDVRAQLDLIPELEAAAKDKLDEAKIEEIVTRRVDGTIRSKMAPVERENAELKKVNAEQGETIVGHVAKDRSRTLHDQVHKALVASKVIPEAHEDALMLADRHFEVTEDGAILTRDAGGITPGLDPTSWLTEIQEKRRHWWPESVGGGAKGSGGTGGLGGKNPFSAENWNMTAQGQMLKEHGAEKTERMAKAAGTTVGGKKPPLKVK